MSFEKFLSVDILSTDFGEGSYIKNFKERQNISKLGLDSDSGCRYLAVNDVAVEMCDEVLGVRYMACMDLIYDGVVSIFNPNTKTLVACRFFEFTKELERRLSENIKKISSGGVEVRVIGFQNGAPAAVLGDAYRLLEAKNLPVVEVDLFGNNVRHVAFDIKTGQSFDVLAWNKPYKPGDLVNKITVAQFERGMTSQAGQPPQNNIATKTK